MHSVPSGPSLIERIATALFRALRPGHGRRIFVRPRVVSVLLGSLVIGLLAAAVPMVSTAPDAPAPVTMDGSSSAGSATTRASRAHRDDVVEMGVDGAPASTGQATPTAPSSAPPTTAAPVTAPLPAAPAHAGSASSAATASMGPAAPDTSAARTPTRSPLTLPQLPIPPIPPLKTSGSPSPTETSATPSQSPSPSTTADPSPQP